MANDKGKGKASPFLVQIVTSSDVLHQLNAIDRKLNLLVEHAGLGDKLDALREELRGPTESLEAAVEANQP